MRKAWHLWILCFFLSAAPFFPGAKNAVAFGPHDKLQCADCHAAHIAGGKNKIRLAALNKPAVPAQRYRFTGVRALCMSCHKKTKTVAMEKMGIGQVCAIHNNHYPEAGHHVDAGAAGVSVPASLLRRGKIRCDSCHDPHGTNPNYKYLIVRTKGKMARSLCAMCHHSNSGYVAVKKPGREIKKQRT